MSEEASALDLLPLLFLTALVVYALAMGSADLPRTVIRASAMACAAFCLVTWGVALLGYDGWGRPVIDEFYATALVQRQLGATRGGWLLFGLAVIPAGFALLEMWRRLKVAR